MTHSPVALVIGAGDVTGSAIARAFAKDGFHAVLVRRPRHQDKLDAAAKVIQDAGFKATGIGCDAREPDDMEALIKKIETEIGPIEVAVFNIGANVRFGVGNTTPRVYKKVWEMGAFAGFLMAHNVAPLMKTRGRGTLLFTGASASTRGAAGFSAFAGAKHALRALAQSCAREFGPDNIHTAHIIIDGMIDSAFIRENIPNFDFMKNDDRILSPDAIAENFVYLHHQPRTAWTFELDLRPYKENW